MNNDLINLQNGRTFKMSRNKHSGGYYRRNKDTMLLFLFSFYLNYGLLNCEEVVAAKFNESFLQKHHQNLLEVDHLLRDLEQQTKELSLLVKQEFENDTIPEEFIYKNTTKHLRSEISEKDQNNKTEKLTNPPSESIFRPSPKYDPFDHHPGLSLHPGHHVPPFIPHLGDPRFPRYLIRPAQSIFPGLMPHSLHSMHGPGHMFLNLPNPMPKRPQILPYMPNFYLQLLKRPPFPNPFLHMYPHEFHPYRPEFHPPFFDPHFEIPHFSRPHSARPDFSIPHSSNAPYSNPPSTLKTPPPDSTVSTSKRTTTVGHHAQVWLKEIAPYTHRKMKKKKASRPHHERPTVPMSSRTTEPTNYWFTTEAASKVQLYNQGEHEYLQESLAENDGSPVEKPQDLAIKEQNPTALSPNQRYLELMKQLGEGYLMVFIIELCRLIAVKDKRDVRKVLAPAEDIVVSKLESNQISRIDDPLLAVIGKMTMMASEGDHIDELRTYSSKMFHTLLERQQKLSSEVNSIVEVADSFYGDDEGRRLLNSLRQFEEYPNTTKPSYQICESLIDSFLQPFRPPAETMRQTMTIRRLLHYVNRALRLRYPQLLKEGGTAVGEARPMIETQPRIKKTKHHHKKRKRKRRIIPEYYNKQI